MAGCGCGNNGDNCGECSAVYKEGLPKVVAKYTESPEYEKLVNILEGIVTSVMQVKPNQELACMNRGSDPVAHALYTAAKRNNISTMIYNITSEKPLTELPQEIKHYFFNEKPHGVINLFDYSIFEEGFDTAEQPFRIDYIMNTILKIPTVCFHVPASGIWKMFTRKGSALDVDYRENERKARALMSALKDAERIHVTGEAGTDYIIEVPENFHWGTDTHFERGSDGKFPNGKEGIFGNLPVGEVFGFIEPKKGKVDGEDFDQVPVRQNVTGKLVCDLASSVARTEKPQGPDQYLTFEFEKGVVTSIISNDKMWEKVIDLYSKKLMGIVVDEILGTGLNKNASPFAENFVEAEKAKGTSHLAFSMVYRGKDGKLKMLHGDHLFSNPTYEIEYKDGSKIVVLEEGVLIV